MKGCARDFKMSCLAALLVAACGGGGSPPAASSAGMRPPGKSTPAPAPAQSGSGQEGRSAPDASSGSADAASSDAEAAPTASETDGAPEEGEGSAQPAAPEPSPRPSDIVTAVGVIYILDYQGSDVSRAARDKCEADAGDDMERRAKCLQAERDKFRADALSFKSSAKGKQLTWYIYRRDGDALKEIYVSRFEFADESAREVAVVPRGGRGARPLYQGRQKVVLEVPSTYELVIQDPRYGRLRYKARFQAGGK